MAVEIPLTKGYVTLVDEADIPTIKSGTWYALSVGTRVYAYGYIRDGKRSSSCGLHRTLLNPGRGLAVDHINGDTLDNRRANLRVVTQAQNNQNLHRARRNSSTGVRGVRLDPRYGTFSVRVAVGGKRIGAGTFKTLEEADAAARAARAKYMTHSSECSAGAP